MRRLKNEFQKSYFFKQLLSYCLSPTLLCGNYEQKNKILTHFIDRIVCLAFLNAPTSSPTLKHMYTLSKSFFTKLTGKLISTDTLELSLENHEHILKTLKQSKLERNKQYNSLNKLYFFLNS